MSISGWAICYAPCIACGRPFGFNPHTVPSTSVTGEREPICAGCVLLINRVRHAKGLPEIVPAADAYAPIEVSQL